MTSVFTSALLAYIFHIYSDKFQKASKIAAGKAENDCFLLLRHLFGYNVYSGVDNLVCD